MALPSHLTFLLLVVNKVRNLAINDVIEGKWLMKMDVEMAAQFDVPNDVRRKPKIRSLEEIEKLLNRIFKFLGVEMAAQFDVLNDVRRKPKIA